MAHKKKIALCLRDMKIGGVETVFINTMDALLKMPDLEFCVITYAKIKEPLYVKWFAAHPEISVHTLYPCRFLGTDLVHFFPVRIIQHLLRDIYRGVLRWMLKPRRFDDVDLFIDYYNFSFDDELKKFSQPRISWWHSSIDAFIGGGYVKYMPNYDMLVALTDGFVDEFKKLYPGFSDKIMRIYNPVDVSRIKKLAATLDAPTGDYFVCVSRLYADKDIETLMRAFDMFWRENDRPDVKLYIIGWGSFATRFRAMADMLDAGKNIIFTGAMTNPFGYMRGAIANILSSRSEGLGMVLIEGASVGTLNISSDCRNGPRDILMDGRGGLLYTPGDVDALARHMTDVWRGGVDTKKMINTATRGLRRFNADQIASKVYDLINKFVK